jgi:predicted RNase H-like HicB family nuclease
MGHRYHTYLFWSDEDGCWIADVPDLTCCSAHGPTPEAALREVEVAVEAWLEAQAAEGRRPAPAPRYRPGIYAGRQAAWWLKAASVPATLPRQLCGSRRRVEVKLVSWSAPLD